MNTPTLLRFRSSPLLLAVALGLLGPAALSEGDPGKLSLSAGPMRGELRARRPKKGRTPRA